MSILTKNIVKCNDKSFSISGMKGRTVSEAGGVRKLKVDDLYDVFKKVKGTPRFWQAAKSDLIAKVKQLGKVIQ